MMAETDRLLTRAHPQRSRTPPAVAGLAHQRGSRPDPARTRRFPVSPGLADLAGRDVDRLDELGARIITRGDPEWPWPQLARLDLATLPSPFALYLRGPPRLGTLTERAITVCGSRAATGYGRTVTTGIAGELTGQGWAITASSEYGIAAAVHKAALAAHGRPMMVLAAGIDIAHPPGYADLLDGVATDGLLVSEYPPGTSVTRCVAAPTPA